jgi:aryl carrier-like protein
MPHVSKNQGCNNNVRVRRNQQLPLELGRKRCQKITDRPCWKRNGRSVDSNALAQRRTIVKKRKWESPVVNRKRGACMDCDWRTGATWLTDRINVIHSSMQSSFTTSCIDTWWKVMKLSDAWLVQTHIVAWFLYHNHAYWQVIMQLVMS